jgi:tetratricopeptide (TPR) repeat protein
MNMLDGPIDRVLAELLGGDYGRASVDRPSQRLMLIELLGRFAPHVEVVAALSDILGSVEDAGDNSDGAFEHAKSLIDSAPAIFDHIRDAVRYGPLALASGSRMVSSSGAVAFEGDIRQIGAQVAGRDLTILNASVSAPAPESPMPVPRQLPPDIADFCDRQQQLAFMLRELRLGDGSTPTVIPPLCIFGQGGIGKTALVVHLSHSAVGSFPDGQIYVDLRGVLRSPAHPLEVVNEFLRALGFEGRRIPSDQREAISLYRSAISDRAVLLVLDNAKDEKQVRPLLPAGRGSRAIVTSRRRLSALEGAAHLRLEVLSDEDSKTLLSHLVGHGRVHDDPSGSELVLRYAAGLPLAVRILGARLAARPSWHFRRLASLLDDEGNRLRHLRVGDLEVEASILASYDDLPPERQAYLRSLTLIDGTQFCAWTAAAIFDVNVDAAEDILDELASSELVAVGGAGPNQLQTYQLHDLVRAFLRSRLNNDGVDELLDAVKRLMWTYIFLLRHVNAGLEPVDLLEEIAVRADVERHRYDVQDILYPNVSEWLRFERERIVSLISRGESLGAYECTWLLARSLAPCLDAYAYWADWERTHVVALAAASRLKDKRAEALVRRGLARLYEETSRWQESEEQITKAMHFFRANDDDSLYASCLRILGDLHRDQGRFLDAIDVYRSALEMLTRRSDEYWRAVLLRSVGDAYRDFGQWDQSVEYLQAARTSFTSLGADRWTAAVLRSLGTVYRDHGPYARALEAFGEALAVFARVGDRSLEAQTLQGIGDTYRNIGENSRAIGPLEAARKMLTELGDTRRSAVAVRSLADIRRRLREYEAASDLLVDCITMFRGLGDYRWELYARRTEGMLRLDMGDFDAATAIFEECYRAFAELGDARWRGNCLRCLGDVFYARGRPDEAKGALLECVDIFAEIDEVRWLGKTYRSLGKVAQSLGERQSAIEYYVKARDLLSRVGAVFDTQTVDGYLRSITSVADGG